MKVSSFFKLVEIKTKLASIVPFLIGTLYTIYHFDKFNLINCLIFLISLFTFDMVTTAINNYIDFLKSKNKSGYNYEKHNAIVRDNLNINYVLGTIIILLTIASVLGVILFLRTDFIVLIIGTICFCVGILYSFGPIPISRTPFGELFSGFFMGFVIIFLSIYIHIIDIQIISFSYINNLLTLNFNVIELFYIVLLSIPSICGIANIMLANNICDMNEDLVDARYTLPNYIGKKNSLIIFTGLYIIAFLFLTMLPILGILPIYSLILLLTIIPVIMNLRKFYKIQTKKDTFSLSVKNFFTISGAQSLILIVIVLIKNFYK